MSRAISESLKQALSRKIILLSGPRQVGKTTLAKGLFPQYHYYNFDLEEHRLLLRKKEWPRDGKLLILDELHKMRSWKRWLKGIYDTEGLASPLLVTGSARLDIARKMGDSLAGRYFQFRLHPLCLKELRDLNTSLDPESTLSDLMKYSGFPEPFFSKDPVFHGQWQSTHLDIMLRQDLIDTEAIRDITGLETLTELLSHRVGHLVTYESLARDLERSPTTIKRWLAALENLYLIFSLTPYRSKISRSLRQARKFYLFDVTRVKNGEGAKFENLVALALLKERDRLIDCLGQKSTLHFLRVKDGKEVDFLFQTQGRFTMVECKFSDDQFAPSLKHFAQFFPSQSLSIYQLAVSLKHEREIKDGPKLVKAAAWLARLPM